MKRKSRNKKKSARKYAEVLFSNTERIFKEFHLSRKDSPLAIMKAANLAFLSQLVSLLEILTKEKKLSFLEEIVNEYRTLLKHQFRGEIADVTTALPLTEKEKLALNEKLASLFDRYYHLIFEVDPELIGGLVVKIGDKVLDESVLGKMKELEGHLNI